MKRKLSLTGLMIAIILCFGLTLTASMSAIKVSGVVSDEFGSGIEGVEVYCVQDETNSTTTWSDGSYDLSVMSGQQINARTPDGYSSQSDQTSSPISSINNEVNFSFHSSSE